MDCAVAPDPLRSVPAAELLGRAHAAAEEAGVTRLADVTRLDRIGLPVWQAVRPASRALSVHQGKGASDAEAQLGALLEAAESHWAESFNRTCVACTFDELPRARRAPTIADFALSREVPPSTSQAIAWVKGDSLPGGREVLLPEAIVSLDFTRDIPSRFDRASNGLASGATRSEAVVAALHELIERDAVVEWQARDVVERIECTLDPASVPFGWYSQLDRRIAATGARMQCFHVPSLTGTPVFTCEINDSLKDGLAYRSANGRAAHAVPEIALFKAVAEACQARATFIAGARDDLTPAFYSQAEDALTMAFGLPQPPGMIAVDFSRVKPGPGTVEDISAALGAAGFRHSSVVTLAEPHGFTIVRVFVCGLGSLSRRRRTEAD